MRTLVLIDRELRTSSRQPFTYNLRVLGVLALLVVLGLFCLEGDLGSDIGRRLFAAMHGALFLGIWTLAPLMTADCISRERREGTLPLLFLSNLNPRDIVSAKGFAHGLKAFTLWLAVVPLLAVPLVAGGVGWHEVAMSALVNAGALFLATAAGLAASAASKVWSRAVALTAILAFLFLAAFTLILQLSLLTFAVPNNRIYGYLNSEWGPVLGLGIAMNWDMCWQDWLGMLFRTKNAIFVGLAANDVFCIGIFLLMLRYASWRVGKIWREQPASKRMLWLQKTLFTPVVLQSWLRKWLRWQLRRNPIGWLEQRSWTGRTVVWSWFAVVLCIYSSLFSNLWLYQRGFHEVQSVLAWLLCFSIALSAAGSFRRERETGVLELLLVSPLHEWQIVGGRVRGLWTQFLPAMLMLFGVWLWSSTFLAERSELLYVFGFMAAFAALPVIGLYFSLVKSNMFVSLSWTLLIGVVLPICAGKLLNFLLEQDNMVQEWEGGTAVRILGTALFQGVLALFLAKRLEQKLRYRRFAATIKG